MNYFLYTSRLPTNAPLSSVSEVVKQARTLNAIAGITGVLGFDGESFVQYVEGPADAILKLRAAIAADTRHTHFSIKAEGPLLSERKFSEWHMGYSDLESQGFDFSALAPLHGDEALQYFINHAESMDFA